MNSCMTSRVPRTAGLEERFNVNEIEQKRHEDEPDGERATIVDSECSSTCTRDEGERDERAK